MSAAAVLHRLHAAGVEVLYQEPDSIRLRGPVTDDLVELARSAKPELLAAVRPRIQVYACSCCGRFAFVEPAVVCFWCRAKKAPDTTDRTSGPSADRRGSVGSVRENSRARPETRVCPSCGGGMHSGDLERGVCFTCQASP